MKYRLVTSMLGSAVVLLGGAACSAPGQGPQLPEKNRAQWVMPLDDYILQFPGMANYAENLAIQPCMQSAGIWWVMPWQDPEGGDGESMNATLRKLFNVPLAERWGYHQAPKDDPSFPAWREFMRKTDGMSEEDSKVIHRCLDEVRKRELPTLPGGAQLATGLEQAAYDAALQDPAVVESGKRWHECMRPQGVSDLPSDPEGMPSRSVRKQFELDVITEESILHGPKVSPEEIALATADARCQESSGYAQKLYDAEWKRHVTSIEENRDTLVSIKKQITDYHAKVLEVIAEHAPSAP